MSQNTGKSDKRNNDLPNFLIPGASRSGTTSLWYYLRDHPEVFMPEKKELRYFDKEENFGEIDWYLDHFSAHEHEQAVGESSPPYFEDRIVTEKRRIVDESPADRIADFNPDMNIIITLRNPVDRAYSQYWKNRSRRGWDEDKDFREVIEEEINGSRVPRKDPCWLFDNSYSIHLNQWFENFPEDQIKVIIFDEWIQDEEAVLEEICEFLDIDPSHDFSSVVDEQMNSGTPYKSELVKHLYRNNPVLKFIYRNYIFGTSLEDFVKKFTHKDSYPEMSEETRQFVYNQLEEEIDKTEDILGRDLDVWRP